MLLPTEQRRIRCFRNGHVLVHGLGSATASSFTHSYSLVYESLCLKHLIIILSDYLNVKERD